mmetsp:Transcript_13506/g.24880  ORF Transcript_13506/g.24880 Transcript_13506/m.24880 type:complete len:247 (+) Transcript_13506:361-1101(+)
MRKLAPVGHRNPSPDFLGRPLRHWLVECSGVYDRHLHSDVRDDPAQVFLHLPAPARYPLLLVGANLHHGHVVQRVERVHGVDRGRADGGKYRRPVINIGEALPKYAGQQVGAVVGAGLGPVPPDALLEAHQRSVDICAFLVIFGRHFASVGVLLASGQVHQPELCVDDREGRVLNIRVRFLCLFSFVFFAIVLIVIDAEGVVRIDDRTVHLHLHSLHAPFLFLPDLFQPNLLLINESDGEYAVGPA